MKKIEQAKKWLKCVGCGEQIRTGERVINYGRREKYCEACEDIGDQNNPEAFEASDDCDDGEAHLRSMEDFAAYKAAGVSIETYYNDRDNGYCH